MVSWKLKNRHCTPIGLDIGHSSIKMIQLAVSDSALSVVAAEKIILEPAFLADEQKCRDFIVSSIRRALENRRFRGTDVISVFPSDKMRITNLRVAQTETENIDEVLKKEAAGRFSLNPDVDSINYIDAGSVRQGDQIKNEYILFAADSQTIRNHIEMLELAKLHPVALDPVACALFRSYRRFFRRQEDKEQAGVFVDVGSFFTTVVFGRNSDISFVKHIAIGTELFNKEIASRLGISSAEAEMLRNRILKRNQRSCTSSLNSKMASVDDTADPDSDDASTKQVIIDAIGTVSEKLAKEISLCFRYYTVTFRGRRAQRAIFSGGGAYETTLLGVLARHLTVEIDIAQPLNGIDMTNADFETDRRGPHCEWAVAVGLTLKGCDRQKSRSQLLMAEENVS